MNCYILDRKVVFDERDKVDARHAALFHGMVDTRFPLDDNNFGDVLIHPLHLRKNIYALGEVLKPSRNLVVSNRLRKVLERYANVGFFRVVFSCLYSVPFETGEVSVPPKDYDDFGDWEGGMEHCHDLCTAIPEYYEFITPRYSDWVDSIDQGVSVQFRSLTYDERVELKVSRGLLTRFPALWMAEGILMNAEVFGEIETCCDWRYFQVHAIAF